MTGSNSKLHVLLKVLSELLRSNPDLFRILSEMYPRAQLAAAPEPVESRWHFLIDCLRWLLTEHTRRQRICQAILQHYAAVERGKIVESMLPSDAQFVLYHLQSSVSQAALCVALDLGSATVKAELAFLQSSHGLHMAPLFDFFEITCGRRSALASAAPRLAETASLETRATAQTVVASFCSNSLSPSEAFGSPVSAPAPSAVAHLSSASSTPVPSAPVDSSLRRSGRSATVSARLATAAQQGVEDVEIDALNSRSSSKPAAATSSTTPVALQFKLPKWTGRTVPAPEAEDCDPTILFPTVFREAKALPPSERELFLSMASLFATRFMKESAIRRPALMAPYLTTSHYMAGIASQNSGQRTARAFVKLGSEGVLDFTSRQTGRSPEEVLCAVKDASYKGPLALFTNGKLLAQLEVLAKSEEQGALWTEPALAELLVFWKGCFAAVPVSADFPENGVKTLAHLKGQQRTSEHIASRFLRNHMNPEHSVLPVNVPVACDMEDSIWQTMLPELKRHQRPSAPLRLKNSAGNPNDVAVAAISASQRKEYNAKLGFNRRYSEEEKAARANPPRPASDSQLQSTARLCRHHFAKRQHEPDPELAADGSTKKKRRRKTNASDSKSSSSADGKAEKPDQ